MSEEMIVDRVDASMKVDRVLFECVDELPLTVGAVISELHPQRIRFLGEFVDDAAAPRIAMKTYTVITKNGPLSVQARGQILESDNEMFRLFNWENGQKNCVGLFDRREVIALFEVGNANAFGPAQLERSA